MEKYEHSKYSAVERTHQAVCETDARLLLHARAAAAALHDFFHCIFYADHLFPRANVQYFWYRLQQQQQQLQRNAIERQPTSVVDSMAVADLAVYPYGTKRVCHFALRKPRIYCAFIPTSQNGRYI